MNDFRDLFFNFFLFLQPATVSRCGMIYLEPRTLGWRPLLTSYLNGELHPALKEYSKDLENFFVWIADGCIDHLRHVSKVKNSVKRIKKKSFF